MIWFVLLLGFRRVCTIAMPNTGHGALARKFIVYKVLTEDWWCETTVDKSSSRFSLQAIYFKDLVRGARWVTCSFRRIVFPNIIEVDAIVYFNISKEAVLQLSSLMSMGSMSWLIAPSSYWTQGSIDEELLSLGVEFPQWGVSGHQAALAPPPPLRSDCLTSLTHACIWSMEYMEYMECKDFW